MTVCHVVFWVVAFISKISISTKTGKNLIAISFEGQKSGTTVRLNCSVSIAPPSKTIECLVDSVTANNIRLYKGNCYLTHKGTPCNSTECQCSQDGKRYYWTYETTKNNFTATCKSKIDKTCNVNSTLQFTDTSFSPHNLTSKPCSPPASTTSCVQDD